MKKIKTLLLMTALMITGLIMIPFKTEAAEKMTSTLDLSACTSSKSNSYQGWSWNYSTKTLLLCGVDIETEGDYDDAIVLPDANCTIVLSGDNILKSYDGITCSGSLTIQGNEDSYLSEEVLLTAFDVHKLTLNDVNADITCFDFGANPWSEESRSITFNNSAVRVYPSTLYSCIFPLVETGPAGTIKLSGCYIKHGGAVVKDSERSLIATSYSNYWDGDATYSDYIEIVRGTAPIVKKSAIKKFYKNYKKVTIFWSIPKYSNGKYAIYRSTKKTSGFKKVGTSTVPYFIDSGLTFNKVYYYFIKAYNSSGSSKSAVKAVRTGLAESYVSVESKSSYDILSLRAVSGATGYKIYRATSYKGKYTPVKTIGKTLTCKIKRPSYSKTYYYKVRAFRKVGSKYYYGPYSDVGYYYPDDEDF